jgi:regulator of RNase E activity RraB
MIRSMRALLGNASEALDADNDLITIGHADANTLFANLKRAKDDLFAAGHAVTEAQDAKVEAEKAYALACQAMIRLFEENDIVDRPLPEPVESQEGADG